MTDGLSRAYVDLLNGQYDGLDRIVLSAYFRFAHNHGGFRLWWANSKALSPRWIMRICGAWRAGFGVGFASGPERIAFRCSRPGRVNSSMRSPSAIARLILSSQGSSSSSKAGRKHPGGTSCRAGTSARSFTPTSQTFVSPSRSRLGPSHRPDTKACHGNRT